CFVALLLCCFVALLLCCFVALLLCCVVALLRCCVVALCLVPCALLLWRVGCPDSFYLTPIRSLLPSREKGWG
ncbi:hypothetical protein, partial [Aeromonas media]|uniref:hypothetical protein n=1 Tax=Aeromonas media TaxID=651 RepID=UPI003D1C809D